MPTKSSVVPAEPPRQNDLKLLLPQLQAKAKVWQATCYLKGLPMVIFLETGRTQARQDWLYNQGRKWPGKIVTWTRDSPHIHGRAFDFAVLHKDGTVDWDNKEAYERAGRIAEELGLQWGEKPGDGDKDLGHIQLFDHPPTTKETHG